MNEIFAFIEQIFFQYETLTSHILYTAHVKLMYSLYIAHIQLISNVLYTAHIRFIFCLYVGVVVPYHQFHEIVLYPAHKRLI